MKILFFASLREQLETGELELPYTPDIATAHDVLQQLQERGDAWQEALQSRQIRVAINQELANLHDPVTHDDELAFFPPVTGG